MADTEEEFEFKDYKHWKSALLCAPNPAWLEERSLGGNKKSIFLPLPIQEALADKLFREFNVVDIRISMIVNEVVCTVKINALPNYPNSEHLILSGTAAKPVQMDTGASASKFPVGKKTNGAEYNVPAAKSAAVSNALTSFANVFGRNINRDKASNDLSFSANKKKKDEAE